MSKSLITASYDDAADVLYVYTRRGVETHNREEEGGLILRYDDATEAPVGATIIDFRDYWSSHRLELASRLADFFGVSKKEAENALRSGDAS